MNTTLVIMAAGMGSRFGGLKQAQPITEDGKGILDFSVYDAKKAGFSDVVFIIREDMEEDFKRLVGERLEKQLPCRYVIQDTSSLPKGRTKPFGTGHAVLSCKESVHNPFCIINADDYYGSNAFIKLERHLKSSDPNEFAMVPFELGKTLSKNGTVSRGICRLSKDDFLESIEECTKIDSIGRCFYEGKEQILPLTTPVSMNIWGLNPSFFTILEKEYQKFLRTADLLKDEFYIPIVIGTALKEGRIKVKAYNTDDHWYGITYREDLPEVKKAIADLIKQGYYEGI